MGVRVCLKILYRWKRISTSLYSSMKQKDSLVKRVRWRLTAATAFHLSLLRLPSNLISPLYSRGRSGLALALRRYAVDDLMPWKSVLDIF